MIRSTADYQGGLIAGRSGRFRLLLGPGRYRLELQQPSRPSDEKDTHLINVEPGAPQKIRIRVRRR